MDVRVVDDTTGLAELREEWEALESRDPHASYYVRHRFVTAWWRSFDTHRDDVELHVLYVSNNDRLVAIVPLSVWSAGDPARRTAKWASHGDYLGALFDPGTNVPPDTVFKAAMDHLEDDDGIHRLDFTNMLPETPLAQYLLKSHHGSSFNFHVENPYVDLGDYDGWDDFDARAVPSKARYYRNKLLREHDVSFRVLRHSDGRLLERLAALHRTEKAYLTEQGREGRRSLFEDPARYGHVEWVFEVSDDVVTFTYEDTHGNLAGYLTCYLDHGNLLSWNTAYNPEFEDYRIGKVIHHDVLAHLFETGLAGRFDFGAGRYQWKFEWTGDFRSTYRLVEKVGEPPKPKPKPESRKAASTPAPVASAVPDALEATHYQDASWRRAAKQVLRSRRARRGVVAVRNAVMDAADRVRSAVSSTTHVWHVPHPDDETLSMGASMARRRHDTNVVVLLTRGGASTAINKINAKLDQPIDHDEFVASRITEFRHATTALGVDPRDLVVYDFADGGLTETDARWGIEEMVRRHPGAVHHAISWLDEHPDHQASGRALLAAYHDGLVGDCVFHLPIPLADQDIGDPVAIRGPQGAAKRAALAEYATWDPDSGRYAVGPHSVAALIERQLRDPVERTHGPGLSS